MAKHTDWDDSMLPDFHAWRATRPPSIQAIIDALPPWNLYLLKTSAKRVTIYAYDEHEDGTVSLQVNVSGQYNLVMAERRVFGVKPENLEECELPPEDETVGSLDISLEVVKELYDAGGGAICPNCRAIWTDACDAADHIPIPMSWPESDEDIKDD